MVDYANRLNTTRRWPMIMINRLDLKNRKIGFEWEVPLNDELWLSKLADYRSKYNKFTRRTGFGAHAECGGVEFQSPIAFSLADAKSLAKDLTEFVSTQDELILEGNVNHWNICGIHASVNQVTPRQRANMGLMCNRTTSAAFIKELGGRHAAGQCTEAYTHNSKAKNWDATGIPLYATRDRKDVSVHNMFRDNNHGEPVTECRIFGSQAHRLPVAIEFTHAIRNFVQSWKGDIPYIMDFRNWLDNQSSYQLLKSEQAWRHVNG